MAEPYGDSSLTFWGAADLFSEVAVPFSIPTSGMEEFQLLHILCDTSYHSSSS